MAAKFEDVKKAFDEYVDKDKIASIESQIDKSLNSSQWLKDWRCGEEGQYYWEITISGELTKGEKQVLAELYLNAGWPAVRIENSDEIGERPGMIGFTFSSIERRNSRNFYHKDNGTN